MYLTIAFVALFRISLGLISQSELDLSVHDFNDGNAEFYRVENKEESKPIKSAHSLIKEPIFISILKTDLRSENLKTSPAFNSSVIEDVSKDITDTESKELYDNISEATLETIADIDDVLNNRISKDSLDIIDEIVGKSLSGGTLEELHARKPRAAIQDRKKKCKASSKILLKTAVGNAELDEGGSCSCKSTTASFQRVPAVCIFVNTAIKAVQSSELLAILFDITDATPQQYSQLKYRFIVDFLRRYGYIDAQVIADFSVRHIARYFDVILPQALIEFSANYIAKLLFAEGILTADNAKKLAQMYNKNLKESAKIHEIDCESGYTTKFQALAEGETRFLLTFGELSYTKAWEIAFYYSYEWLLVAVDYGNLKDLTA